MSFLFLEDLSVGDLFESRSVSISAGEIKAFAAEYDPQPFHLDEDLAAGSYFSGLSASGWHVGSITMRLLTESLPIGGGVIGGGVDVRWLSATRPGDRLRTITEIKAVEPSKSKLDRGKVTIFTKTLNQSDEIRQTIESTLLVFKKNIPDVATWQGS